MSNTFKIGDVVRLKSGGPRMTVDWIGECCLEEDEDDITTCASTLWFEELPGGNYGELKNDTFDLGSLCLADA